MKRTLTDAERLTSIREAIEAANGDWHEATALWSVCKDIEWLLSQVEAAAPRSLDAAWAIELDRLEALARAATPGPWRQSGTEAKPHWFVMASDVRVQPVPERRSDYVQESVDRWIADAAYIAAVSPDVILALTGKLRERPAP